MPLEKVVHGGSATAKVLLERRQLIAAGISLFLKDEEAPPQPDTSRTASCTCCTPPARFVATAGKTPEEWAELHRERERLPKPPKMPENGTTAVALIRATIADRIASGELKAGQVLKQLDLAREVQVHARWMSTAIGQLVAEGVLGYVSSGSGSARRAIVV